MKKKMPGHIVPLLVLGLFHLTKSRVYKIVNFLAFPFIYFILILVGYYTMLSTLVPQI